MILEKPFYLKTIARKIQSFLWTPKYLLGVKIFILLFIIVFPLIFSLITQNIIISYLTPLFLGYLGFILFNRFKSRPLDVSEFRKSFAESFFHYINFKIVKISKIEKDQFYNYDVTKKFQEELEEFIDKLDSDHDVEKYELKKIVIKLKEIERDKRINKKHFLALAYRALELINSVTISIYNDNKMLLDMAKENLFEKEK